MATLGVAGHSGTVPFSIASAPEETAAHGWVEFLIKVEASGRWGHRFERLARGMRVTLGGPMGIFTFPPAPAERRFLFIAGGTGIAPMRAMLAHIELAHVPGRARLLYSARTPDDFPVPHRSCGGGSRKGVWSSRSRRRARWARGGAASVAASAATASPPSSIIRRRCASCAVRRR